MHVRVCRDCHEEYRPEIAVCADCGGALEDRYDDEPFAPQRPAAPPAPQEPADPEDDTVVFGTDYAPDLKPLADRLLAAGIEFRLRPRRGSDGTASTGLELRVRAADHERALRELAPLLAGPDVDPSLVGAVAGEFDEAAGYRRCPACGCDLGSGAEECPDCGLGVGGPSDGRPCGVCGRTLTPDDRRCPSCGFDVGGEG
jgi:hypothetical protein